MCVLIIYFIEINFSKTRITHIGFQKKNKSNLSDYSNIMSKYANF